MDAAPLAYKVAPARPQLDADRLRDIVLVRIATAAKGLTRADLARDLWPIVAHLLTASEWPGHLDRDLGALANAGLCDVRPVAVTITAAGVKRAGLVLGIATLPRTWADAFAVRLIAKTLDMDAAPPRRLKALTKASGLRLAIVQHGFGVAMKGLPTPVKLRIRLAGLALARAFGGNLPTGVDARSGLSAKAGRALAGRLAVPPRDFPTDARLLAELAMQCAGAKKGDLVSLQTALLRRYVTRQETHAVATPNDQGRPRRARTTAKASRSNSDAAPHLRLLNTPATPPNALPAALPRPATRPDFESFVAAVRSAAGALAEGWPGNRKAYVSRVWGAVQSAHPQWAVSTIEFKAMLVEAHRLGRLVLANADLKDQRAIGDLQASAIAYKNAIFHYVRVDD